MTFAPYIKSSLWLLAYLLFVYLAESFFVYLFNFDFFYNLNDNYIYFLDTVVYVFLFLLLLVFHRFFYKERAFFACNKIAFKDCLVVIFLIVLLRIVRDPIINFDYVFFDKELPTEFYRYSTIELIANLINVVLLASIFEEILFRKIIIDFFLKKNKIIEGVVFSSLLFSLIHINFYRFEFSLSSIATSFIFGLILGYIYTRTRNVLYPIIAHITANFIWLLLGICIEQYWDVIKLFNFGFAYWLIIAASIIGIFFTLRKINPT